MNINKVVIILFSLTLMGCSQKSISWRPDLPFSDSLVPPPDYSKSFFWSALPEKGDYSDLVPSDIGLPDEKNKGEADVFFIHPTSYLRSTKQSKQWNANVLDEKLNSETDRSSILYQASSMNGAGRIYAPHYRQARISVYVTDRKDIAKKALDLAYSDVMQAFQYYLDNFNHGRPIIIASHSQGSTHAIRLMQDFFDGKPLIKQLVAAYIIGAPVYDSLFTNLKPCMNAEETGCYVSWRTYATDYFPPGYLEQKSRSVCTNPLTWTTDTTYAPKELNHGGVLKNFNKIFPHLSDAQVKEGVLMIHKPDFPGSAFIDVKNYHIVDYNLFYVNIRENAILRVKKFIENELK